MTKAASAAPHIPSRSQTERLATGCRMAVKNEPAGLSGSTREKRFFRKPNTGIVATWWDRRRHPRGDAAHPDACNRPPIRGGRFNGF
jgi:hypothetical protein